MLKRALLLLAALWAFAFLANGATKSDGIGRGDVMLAFAPLVIGWLCARGGRFVVTGSPVRPSGPVPYRRP